MSVTHVISGGLAQGRHVKPQAIPASFRFGTPRPPVLVMTADRTRRVGRPTTRRAPAAAVLDPLVAEAADTALESLDLLEQRAGEIARDVRWNRSAAGRRGLMDLVTGIQSLVQLAVATAEAAGHDLECLGDADGRGASEMTRRAVHALVEDQVAEDWHALAATLESRLIPALDAWRTVFLALTGPLDGGDHTGCAA